MYVHGTLPPHESWIMVGIGLRLAQDVGAHRRRSHHGPPTVEDELCKRAFWCAPSLCFIFPVRIDFRLQQDIAHVRYLDKLNSWSSLCHLGRKVSLHSFFFCTSGRGLDISLILFRLEL